MRYDYHTYTRYLRRIKTENDIRINELKKVIECLEARKTMQKTLHDVNKHRTDTSVWYWHSGYICAYNHIIELLKLCILDYEGKL